MQQSWLDSLVDMKQKDIVLKTTTTDTGGVQEVHQESWDLIKKLNKFNLGEGGLTKMVASVLSFRSLEPRPPQPT